MTEFYFFLENYSFKCACVEHTTILIYEFMGVDDSFYIKLLENASNKCSDCRKIKMGEVLLVYFIIFCHFKFKRVCFFAYGTIRK